MPQATVNNARLSTDRADGSQSDSAAAGDDSRPDPARGATGAQGRVSDEPNATSLQAPTRIKVLVVNDRQLLAEALGIVLGADPDLEVVGTDTDPELAAQHIRQTHPDVVLLDYFGAYLGGAQVTATLRAEFKDLKIIFLTSSFNEDVLLACIQAGAAGYLTTDRPPAELIRAVKQVYGGEMLFAPAMLVNLLTRSQRQHQLAEPQEAMQPLAPRELEVLQTLATGMNTEEAAARLGITVHTVRTHLKNVMIKLQAHSKLEAVMFALKKGLIKLPE